MHEISTFKNKPIIKLKRDGEDKFPFTFGVNKAKLILDNYVAIEKFVAKNDKAEVAQEKVLI
ncbi:MAG: hypothetical protein PHT32_06475 [Candidatus Omnitrophica bacterium]|nr:hypothetical protein [Candidatus Omnitrophota bacterium]